MTAHIPQNDIRNIWSDVWLRTANEWQDLQPDEHLKLIDECWEVYDVQDKIYQGRANLEDYRYLLDTPAERFMDNVAIPLLTVGSMFTPATAPAALAGVARTAVAVTPRLMQVATALGAAEVCQEMMTFFSKKAEGDPKPRAGTEGYKSGKNWDSLKGVNTRETQHLGKINKEAFGGGEIRTDGEYLYRFDRAHKTGKVHMEKYKKVARGWKPCAECDPVTGEEIAGSAAKVAERAIIRW